MSLSQSSILAIICPLLIQNYAMLYTIQPLGGELFLINFDREDLVGDTKFPKKEGLVGGRATKHHILIFSIQWFTIL